MVQDIRPVGVAGMRQSPGQPGALNRRHNEVAGNKPFEEKKRVLFRVSRQRFFETAKASAAMMIGHRLSSRSAPAKWRASWRVCGSFRQARLGTGRKSCP
ncbi:hypothetical protein HYPGJ_31573 [Hyphomicrobium sp. GJ21]|nr:hypothetical protein HYPGJ_31573 [Hyphomicrobium sp. GJ21]